MAQNIFQSRLLIELATDAPMEDAQVILKAGAETVRQVVDVDNLSGVLRTYNVAITQTFVSRLTLMQLLY